MSYSFWRRRRALLRQLLHGLLLAALAGIAGAEPAASPPPTAEQPTAGAQPRLEIANTTQDAGTCLPGTELTFRFIVKNTGTSPLHLLKVKPHCGCVVASYDNPIPPGGSGVIKAVLDTLTMSRQVRKLIDVESDDPNARQLTLVCQVTVDAVIETEPSETVPVMLDNPPSSVVEVTLHSTETIPLQIRKVECAPSFLKVRLLPPGDVRERGNDPLHDAVAQVRAPSGSGSEAFTGQVTFHTNSKRRPALKMTFFRIGEPGVAVSPPRLSFGRVPAAEKSDVRRVLVLTSRTRPFKVLSARTQDPHLRLEIPAGAAATSVELGVHYTGGWKPGRAGGMITIRTDDRQYPVLTVPFTALVTPEVAKPAS